MKETIFTGCITLIGVIIGTLTTWLTSRDARKMERLKDQVQSLKKQILLIGEQTKSYWNLERIYAQDLASERHKNEETILKEYRTKIEEDGYKRPTMTENDINKILREYNVD